MHKKDLLNTYQRHQEEQQAFQDHALLEAARLARMLVEDFGAHTVYSCGPVTYGQFSPGMPLELGVEGISSDMFARAFRHLNQISRFTVELIDVARTDSWTKQAMQRKGHVLAKASQP